MRGSFIAVATAFAAIAAGLVGLGIAMTFFRPASDHGGGIIAICIGAATAYAAYIFAAAARRARATTTRPEAGTTSPDPGYAVSGRRQKKVQETKRVLIAFLIADALFVFLPLPGFEVGFRVVAGIVFCLGALVGAAAIVDKEK